MIVLILRMNILRMQVGPGDDYTVTLEGFNALSTLRDSMTPSGSSNLNGMKFTTK